MDQPLVIQVVGGILILAAFCLAIGLVYLVLDAPGRRRRARPSWARLMADTDYLQSVLNAIFQFQGYTVLRCLPLPDPHEREVRDLVFELHRDGLTIAALCGRWVIPITSEIVTRFQTALVLVQAGGGMIVTTSSFTEAAIERARLLAGVTLHDGAAIRKWIAELWPE